MEKIRKYGQLFWVMFYLSAFTFGGGYVIVSLMQKEFVEKKKWISKDEMLDLIAIAQSAPGPIAVNGAIAIGYKMAGIGGMICAVLATILPPFLIMVAIWYGSRLIHLPASFEYAMKGMEIAVCALIVSVVYDMQKGFQKKPFPYIVAGITIVLTGFLNVSIPLVLLLWIVCGLLERRKQC